MPKKKSADEEFKETLLRVQKADGETASRGIGTRKENESKAKNKMSEWLLPGSDPRQSGNHAATL